MRCAEMGELLSAYVDGQAGSLEQQTVVTHLAECPRCRAALRRQQQTRRLLNLASDERWTPPDLRFRVAHVLQAPRPARRTRWSVLGVAAASLAALMLAVALLASQIMAPQAAPAPAAHSTPAAVHARAGNCRWCPVYTLAERPDLTRAERTVLLEEAVSASLPARTIHYPPLPAGWPATTSVPDQAVSKGGEATQLRNAPAYALQPL
ncbi:MAG TPA: anti-sigma factor [Chloroflexota bacterium]|nr:anti-sigma factor [Chloroflexota bacterium]